jgi:hypothetical protein
MWPIDVKRVTGIDLIKGTPALSRALKNPMNTIPIKGKVYKILKPNDHLLCDITASEIWIKFKVVIEANLNDLVDVEFDVKFD